MNDFTEELGILSREASRIRVERAGTKRHWPEDFKRKVIGLLSRGVNAAEMVGATGLTAWMFSSWRRQLREPGFSEVKVTTFQKSADDRVILQTPRGYEATLTLSGFRILLREGCV